MFRSLSSKTALLFAASFAAFFSLMLFAQSALTVYSSVGTFEKSVYKVFNKSFAAELEDMLNVQADVQTGTAEEYDQREDNAKLIYDRIMEYASALGLSYERSVSVLNENCEILYSSDCELTSLPEKTPSIASALAGNEAINISLFKNYSDYAAPINEPSGHKIIVYVSDTNEYILNNLRNGLNIGILFFAVGIIAAFFIGYKISLDATSPLKQLSKNAKRLADGNTSVRFDSTETEIRELSDTITALAKSLEQTSSSAKREKNKLETILQNMTDGILAFDLRGKLIHINHEAQRILNRNYLEDANFDTLFKELKANISIGDLLYINHNDEIMERQVTTEGGTVIRMTFTTFSLEDKISGIVVVLRDITDQEKLEEARKNFVADVSHELRTPLTTIKSYSETLMDNPDTGRELSVKFLNVISSEADRMVRIISDLLTLSKLDAKHSTFKQPESIDVRKLLEAVCDRMALTAKKKDQALTYNPINEVPVIVGDRDALERVIVNIVGNALKYTPLGGKIDVFSSKVYNDICIKVADNGIGIPEENLPHIFDRFYRVDKARSRDTGGTGLGLAIAKQSIEMAFSGKIIISSEPGKGTEVIITIPVPES